MANNIFNKVKGSSKNMDIFNDTVIPPGTRSLQVGNFYKNVNRGLPTMDKFNKWANNFLNSDMLKDYNAYLWGSFPEKKTKDIDILLSKGKGIKLNPAEMEEISMANLDESLVKNNFLIDLGFTENKITPFKDLWKDYEQTGKPMANTGIIFGENWYLDGDLYKNRAAGMRTLNGPNTPIRMLGNNMVEVDSEIPYPKMIKRAGIKGLPYYYQNKPMKIKSAGEGYSGGY